MSYYDLSAITVLTGAGISAESGIPTFRGRDGVWNNYQVEDLATPEAFARDPKFVWVWYEWRRQLVAHTQPNPAHITLAAMERELPNLTIITQNVDGLHAAAGSHNIVTMHGDLWTMRCTHCGHERTDHSVPLAPLPPTCPVCGGIMRPGVVWFGEAIPARALERAYRAINHSTLLLVIGTSAQVYPAASLPRMAIQRRVPVIEFNIEETPLSLYASEVIHGPAAKTLPDWWKRAFKK